MNDLQKRGIDCNKKSLLNLKENKDSIEIFFLIANFFATAIIAFWGFSITNNSNKLTELQIYPFFNVGMITQKADENSENYYSQILVTNLGGNYYNLECSTASYYLIIDKQEKYYIPINALFSIGQPFALSNESKLVYARTSDSYFRLYDITKLDFSEPNSDLLNKKSISGIITFVKLYYQNCDGEYKTQYFNAHNGYLMNPDEGKYYFNYFAYQGTISDFDVANKIYDLNDDETIIEKLRLIINLPKDMKTMHRVYPYK